MIAGASIGMTGFIIIYTQTSPGVTLVGVVLAAAGIFPCTPVTLAWASSNAGGDIKRGVAIAMVTGLAGLGGCVAFVCGIFYDPVKPSQDMFVLYFFRSAPVPCRPSNKHGFDKFIVRLLLMSFPDRRAR